MLSRGASIYPESGSLASPTLTEGRKSCVAEAKRIAGLTGIKGVYLATHIQGHELSAIRSCPRTWCRSCGASVS